MLSQSEQGHLGDLGLSAAMRWGCERSKCQRGPITVWEYRATGPEGGDPKWWVRSISEGRPERVGVRSIYVYESGHCIWCPVKQAESEK